MGHLRFIGGLLYVVGGLAVFGIDILSSLWLAANHGVGWVIVSWITFAPLFIIPFLAGLGFWFVIAAVVTYAGSVMVDA